MHVYMYTYRFMDVHTFLSHTNTYTYGHTHGYTVSCTYIDKEKCGDTDRVKEKG